MEDDYLSDMNSPWNRSKNMKDDYLGDVNSEGRIRNFDGVDRRMVTVDEVKNAQEEYRQALASGEYQPVAQRGSTADINNFNKQKYGAPLIITSEEEINRYNRARDLQAPRSDGKYADQVNKLQPDEPTTGEKIKEGAKFVGKNILLPAAKAAITSGGSIGLEGALKAVAGNAAKDYVTDKVTGYVKDKTGIGAQSDIPEGAISSSAFPFSEGGRVNKALGGPIDLAARKKQSQLDYLARQGKSAPQPPTGG